MCRFSFHLGDCKNDVHYFAATVISFLAVVHVIALGRKNSRFSDMDVWCVESSHAIFVRNPFAALFSFTIRAFATSFEPLRSYISSP